MNARELQDKRTDAYARIAEACVVLKLPPPREIYTYSNGVLSMLFDYQSEMHQWATHLCLSGERHPEGMWRGWKTYVNGVA